MPRTPAKKAATDDNTLAKLLWEITRAWRLAMDRRLKPLGLSDAKWRTVLHLSKAGEMSQAELASRLSIEAPTLARLLDRLAADGWIERRADPNDRRVKTVHLLPKASDAIRQVNKTMNATREEIVAGIPARELRACISTLEQLRERAERAAHRD